MLVIITYIHIPKRKLMKKNILPLLLKVFFLSIMMYAHTNSKAQTMESLQQKLTELESKLNALQEKLPFQDMAVMTLIAKEENMTAQISEYGTIYLPRIKIDNPVCNNNPKAVVLAVNQAETARLQPINVVYDDGDGYWYLTTPQFRIVGFTPGLHITEVLPTGVVRGQMHEIKDMMNSTGIPTVGPQRPRPGERFSVIIFSELLIPMTKIVEPVPTQAVVVAKIVPVTGEWQFKMVSAGGSVFTGKVFLVENGTNITGNLMTPDNTNTKIAGTFINGIISISRETGLQTTQQYELTRVEKNRFSGTYSNIGKYPDSGTIEFFR